MTRTKNIIAATFTAAALAIAAAPASAAVKDIFTTQATKSLGEQFSAHFGRGHSIGGTTTYVLNNRSIKTSSRGGYSDDRYFTTDAGTKTQVQTGGASSYDRGRI